MGRSGWTGDENGMAGTFISSLTGDLERMMVLI